MRQSDEINELLTELRDMQRGLLEECWKVTQQSLGLQRQAAARPEQFGKLYRQVLTAGAALIIFIVIVIINLTGMMERLR